MSRELKKKKKKSTLSHVFNIWMLKKKKPAVALTKYIWIQSTDLTFLWINL